MSENWDQYKIQEIKAKLPNVYVRPENLRIAEQWCYDNVGKIWRYIPYDIFDPLYESAYYFFWIEEGNRFYFKEEQFANTLASLWGTPPTVL